MAAPAEPNFDQHVLKELEKLFDPDDLEVLIHRSGQPDKIDSAVKVRHLSSGKVAMSDRFATQIRNKASCLLTLLLDTSRVS